MQGTIAISGSRSFEVKRGNRGVQRLRDIARQALPTTESRVVNKYRIKNIFNVWRGLWRIAVARAFGIGHIYGAAYVTLIKGDGRRIEYGLVSLRLVTNAGVAYIVDAFQNLVEAENMKFHGFGTGTTNEAVGDTALGTELTTQYATDSTRPTGSQTEAAANIYRTVATLTPDSGGVLAITEHGIFSATSAGVLLDRSKFAAINVDSGSGDSLQVTYDLTLPAGS